LVDRKIVKGEVGTDFWVPRKVKKKILNNKKFQKRLKTSKN